MVTIVIAASEKNLGMFRASPNTTLSLCSCFIYPGNTVF